jgi:hypothetical protein
LKASFLVSERCVCVSESEKENAMAVAVAEARSGLGSVRRRWINRAVVVGRVSRLGF